MQTCIFPHAFPLMKYTSISPPVLIMHAEDFLSRKSGLYRFCRSMNLIPKKSVIFDADLYVSHALPLIK